MLAAGEVALAMVLLVAAGLLLRSFAKLMSVSPGFDVEHVVKADISLPRFQVLDPAAVDVVRRSIPCRDSTPSRGCGSRRWRSRGRSRTAR